MLKMYSFLTNFAELIRNLLENFEMKYVVSALCFCPIFQPPVILLDS